MPDMNENDSAVLNYIFDPNITLGLQINEDGGIQSIDEEESSEEAVEAKEVELEGVRAAERGEYERAIEILSRSIAMCQSASGYNNRAQAFRLIGDDTSAMEDLDSAIRLSNGKGKAGCQALCQRGVLYRKLGDDEKARSDFKSAAEQGSQFAKRQLVEMNPYAAMCNQMLNQMISKINTPKNDS